MYQITDLDSANIVIEKILNTNPWLEKFRAKVFAEQYNESMYLVRFADQPIAFMHKYEDSFYAEQKLERLLTGIDIGMQMRGDKDDQD